LPYLEIGERQIEYSIVRRPSGRYTYMRFLPDLTLEISVPSGRSVDINALIEEKHSWINYEYARAVNSKRILGPEGVMFGGQYLKLIQIEDIREELTPDFSSGEVVVRSTGEWRVKELVRRWFLKETSNYVIRQVHE